ncbi:29858_t:CDS:2, partial [Gigaspora margarita]
MDSEVDVACIVISITCQQKEKFSSGILQRSCRLWALSKLKHTVIESSSWPTILIVEYSSLSVMDVPVENQALS